MFHIVAVNLYGDAIATETIELPYENSDAYYTALAANVELFIQTNHYDPGKIVGISIATQGIISRMELLYLRRYYGKCKYAALGFFLPASVPVPSGARLQSCCGSGTLEPPTA